MQDVHNKIKGSSVGSTLREGEVGICRDGGHLRSRSGQRGV